MKKNYTLFLAIGLFVIAIYLTAFNFKPNSSETPARQIKQDFLSKVLSFEAKVEMLLESLQKAENIESWKEAQQAFKECRYQYKKIEFLAEYVDNQFARQSFNGAPLPYLETSWERTNVVQPSGLQILEELIFSDEPLVEKSEILRLTTQLHKEIGDFHKVQSSTVITDRMVFEAARYEIIRIVALGITGFDTPVTLNSLPEAVIVIKVLQETIASYYPLLKKYAPEKKLEEKLATTFEKTIQYLNANQDFDSFDRLHFIKTFANPLFKYLLEAHISLGIETYYETPPFLPEAMNYYADNIFSEELLNPFYYTKLTKEEYQKPIIELGKMLFFDPVLSENNERACASCHQPGKAFTDGLTKSLATDYEGTVERNAPTLVNAVFADRYFYDLRVDQLENQIEHVILSEKEFATDHLVLVDELKKSKTYQKLFAESIPTLKEISAHTISLALGAYVNSLRSLNSPFDKYIRGESNEYDPQAYRGFNLFMGKAACGTCHFAPTFSGLVPPLFKENESEILGVPMTKDTINPEVDPDIGRAGGSIRDEAIIYKHSFKTTTVRNIELTAPYMHNGVYNTLEEVLDFYNKGGGVGLGLDLPYQTLPPDPLHLTEQEQQDIIAFMKTLTDINNLQDKPTKLPAFPAEMHLENRPIGGSY